MKTPLFRVFRKARSGWQEVDGWWSHTPLSYFDPLISFANQDIQDENWKHTLWEAMGKEKFCWVTYATNKGIVKERVKPDDITSHVSMEIGLGWAFPADKVQEIIRTIHDAIIEINLNPA